MTASTARPPWGAVRVALAGIAGVALGGTVVVALARISAPEPVARQLLGSWLGLLPEHLARGGPRLVLTCLVYGGVVGLVALWAVAVRAAAARRLRLGATVGLWATWTLPFALGPPLFSRDVYSFLAQGELVSHHLDPYRVGPQALGPSLLLSAVDHFWRATAAPYGPLALRIQQWCATTFGVGAGGVVALRLVALLSVVAGVAVAIRLAHPRPPAAVIALYGMNPIVLFHLVSGAHLEALLAALALAGLLAHRRGHPLAGLALVSAASAVKAPELLVVGLLGLLDVVGGRSVPDRLRLAVRDSAVIAAVWIGCFLLVPDPLGWLSQLGTAGTVKTLATPAVAVGHLAVALAHLGRIPLGIGAAVALSTAVAAAVALLWVLRLVVTLSRRDLLRTAGFALVGVALLGPTVHPWYLMWGAVFLIPAAAGGAVRTRKLLLIATGYLALLELPGLTGQVSPVMVAVAVVAKLVVVAVVTAWPEQPGAPREPLLVTLRRIPAVLAGT